jgi:hypothetical protein
MSASPKHLRTESLAELCSYWDKAFIERAYWTLLGRAPDPDGGTHYLNRLRNGVSKLTILLRLRESKEGRERDPKIAGLDKVLARHRQAIHPITGPVVRFFTRREGDTRLERAQRTIINHVAAIHSLAERSGADTGAVSGVSQIGSASRTETGMVDHMLMRLVRVEAALKRIEDRLRAEPAPQTRGKAGRKL